jgi:hypothetical protein
VEKLTVVYLVVTPCGLSGHQHLVIDASEDHIASIFSTVATSTAKMATVRSFKTFT